MPAEPWREGPRASSVSTRKPYGGAQSRRTSEQSEPQVDLLKLAIRYAVKRKRTEEKAKRLNAVLCVLPSTLLRAVSLSNGGALCV